MKTPEEIKKGLWCCQRITGCADCPYRSEKCALTASTDALAYIQQLEHEKEMLLHDFQLYRERNIKREKGPYACDLCQHGVEHPSSGECHRRGCDGMGHWEWRGVNEEVMP